MAYKKKRLIFELNLSLPIILISLKFWSSLQENTHLSHKYRPVVFIGLKWEINASHKSILWMLNFSILLHWFKFAIAGFYTV
jgi:hypothetical protein